MRTTLLTLAAASVLLAPASASANGTHHFRTWRITRTTSAAVPLTVSVEMDGTGPRDLVVVFALRGSGKNRTVPLSVITESARKYPVVYGVGSTTYSVCPSLLNCEAGSGERGILTISTNGERIRDEYFVVTDNASVTVSFGTPGWRVREVAATGVHRIFAEDTGATGASAVAGGVEKYAGTSAPGGRYGSLAWAFLPCELAGSGTATLDATPARPGKIPPRMTCGGLSSGGVAASSDPDRVTWRVSGSSVGVTTATTRLLAVDFPKG